MVSRSLSTRLAALEARYRPPSADVLDRATALIDRMERVDPGGTARAVRDMGLAAKLPGLVAESEAHAQLHRTGLRCPSCEVPT
ncbi:hypothetical protein ACFU51_01335 [Streptomyces sp. NPDC057430]|uniref:hypothetical protein n=1 Tax=Streptomyces sp. NPDC057430 TaxID=3346131 RepID=UPI0036CC788E